MGIHYWGDEDFDWKSLSKAINEASGIMRRWGRIGVHSKEKYGTARLYIYFYHGGLFSIFYPGYVSYWPWSSKKYIGKYLLWLEYNVWQPITQKLRLYVPICWWQKLVYNYAYQRVLVRYPHIAEEIIEDADYPELIADWHKYMWKGMQRNTEYLQDRWHKTAEFFERAMVIAEGAHHWKKEYEDLKKEYEEFDKF